MGRIQHTPLLPEYKLPPFRPTAPAIVIPYGTEKETHVPKENFVCETHQTPFSKPLFCRLQEETRPNNESRTQTRDAFIKSHPIQACRFPFHFQSRFEKASGAGLTRSFRSLQGRPQTAKGSTIGSGAPI